MTNAYGQGANIPLHLPLYGATVGQAWSRFWKKGFTFAGRSSRSEYWWVTFTNGLLVTALYVLTIVIAAAAANSGGSAGFTIFVMFVLIAWSLVIVIPGISLTVRRLHDANLSGGAWFVCLIPFVGGLILFIFTVLASNPLGARFDAPPTLAPLRPTIPPPPPPAPATSAGNAVGREVPPAPISSSFVNGEPVGVAAPQAFVPPSTVQAPLAPPPPPPPVSVAPSMPTPPPPTPSIDPTPAQTWQPPAAQPATAAPEVFSAADPDDDLDATRLSVPRASAAWTAVLADGRRLPLGAPLIFGRNPVGGPAYAGATLVPVGDATSSVSKTHAVVVLKNGLLAITDLRSTNGTMVTDAEGRTISLTPGTPLPLSGPARVTLGDYEIQFLPAS